MDIDSTINHIKYLLLEASDCKFRARQILQETTEKKSSFLHGTTEKVAVLCFLGNLLASELLVPTFRNFLSVPSS